MPQPAGKHLERLDMLQLRFSPLAPPTTAPSDALRFGLYERVGLTQERLKACLGPKLSVSPCPLGDLRSAPVVSLS